MSIEKAEKEFQRDMKTAITVAERFVARKKFKDALKK